MEKIIGILQRNVLIGPLIAVLLLVIGFAVGLGVGWMTVDFKPGTTDVIAAADAYATNNDAAFAKQFLKNLSNDELARILNEQIRARTASGKPLEADRFRKLADALGVNLASPAAGPFPVSTGITTRPLITPTPTAPSPFDVGALVAILLIVLAFLLVAAIIVILGVRILPSLRARGTARTPAAPLASTAPAVLEGERPAPAIPSPPATTTPGGLGRFVPSYTLGNDNYDTSYSLETARGEFLGECGMGISETIGEGKPDKVVAFDLWLFDKADVRTVTQILMSEYAFKDQTLRTKLGAKGEAILVEKGKTLRFETASLRVDAHIAELVYATNPNYPPNSHFQKVIVEIVPSLKADGGTAH
jgi:hypothetical protein